MIDGHKVYSMPTLEPTIGPHHWESFHLNKSFYLVCNEVNERNYKYITSSEVIMSRTKNPYW